MTCSFNIYSYYVDLCRVWVKAILNQRKYSKYYSNQISKHFDIQKRVFKGVVFCTPYDFIPPKSAGLIGLKARIHRLELLKKSLWLYFFQASLNFPNKSISFLFSYTWILYQFLWGLHTSTARQKRMKNWPKPTNIRQPQKNRPQLIYKDYIVHFVRQIYINLCWWTIINGTLYKSSCYLILS